MPDELQLLIEKMVYGGDGLSHAQGNTVFVPYVLPGEQVKAAIVSRKKKLVWATPLEIETAHAERVKPFCPHFAVCGGCHYQHASYDEQVKLKIEILRLEGLVKKLQSELMAEREYSKALEAHLKTLQDSE